MTETDSASKRPGPVTWFGLFIALFGMLIGLVAPRPIVWITSMNVSGQLNAAPFSAYNYVGMDPPIVAVGVGNRPGPDVIRKDTAHNIRPGDKP